MELFDNEKYKDFFSPLCSKYRMTYYDCIKLMLDMQRVSSPLYEEEVKDAIKLYLKNKQVELASDEGMSYEGTDDDKSSQLISYLRAKGWVSEKEVGRTGDNLTSVTMHCRRLIKAIDEIFGNKNVKALPRLLTHIRSNTRVFASEDRGDAMRERPYELGLQPIYDDYSDLRDEVCSVKGDIRLIRQYVLQTAQIQGLNSLVTGDESAKKFFEDYRSITKGGVFPQMVKEIKDTLYRIEGSELREAIIKDCMRAEDKSKAEAIDTVNGMFTEMEAYFDVGYDEDVSVIDRQTTQFYKIWNARLVMLSQGGADLDVKIDNILSALQDMPDNEENALVVRLGDLFVLREYKIASSKSLIFRDYRPRENKTAKVVTAKLSDEKKKELLNEARERMETKYDVFKTRAFVEKVMGGKSARNITKSDISCTDDALYLASSVIHTGDDEFPFIIKKRTDMSRTII